MQGGGIDLDEIKNNDIMKKYQKSDNIFDDIQKIIDTSQKEAYRAVNTILLQRNWLIGYRIAEEELTGDNRAEYGANIIKKLSKKLTEQYGRGFTKSNLYSFYTFYKAYPEIFQTLSGKFGVQLSWSHYAILSKISDKTARNWYELEAVREAWSVRTLQRNVDSQYYYRILKSQVKEPVKEEMKELTKTYQQDRLELIKNPMVVEFLGLELTPSFTETQLEGSSDEWTF